jgi:membrane protease YdiL (CAAX protease family)
MDATPESSPPPPDAPPTGGGASPAFRGPTPALRAIDFCAFTLAVIAVEYVGRIEMRRLGITDPASIQAVRATLVIRIAQMAAIFVPLAVIRGVGPAAFGLRLGDWRRGLVWSAAVSVLLLLGFGLAAAAAYLVDGTNLIPMAFGRSPLATAATPVARAVILAAMVVVGPLAEEIFFRGGLYTVLRRSLSAPQALLASSLLFAAVHGRQIHLSAIQFIGGLAFGWLYEKTGTLFAPVLVHAAGNLAILLIPLLV